MLLFNITTTGNSPLLLVLTMPLLLRLTTPTTTPTTTAATVFDYHLYYRPYHSSTYVFRGCVIGRRAYPRSLETGAAPQERPRRLLPQGNRQNRWVGGAQRRRHLGAVLPARQPGH